MPEGTLDTAQTKSPHTRFPAFATDKRFARLEFLERLRPGCLTVSAIIHDDKDHRLEREEYHIPYPLMNRLRSTNADLSPGEILIAIGITRVFVVAREIWSIRFDGYVIDVTRNLERSVTENTRRVAAIASLMADRAYHMGRQTGFGGMPMDELRRPHTEAELAPHLTRVDELLKAAPLSPADEAAITVLREARMLPWPT